MSPSEDVKFSKVCRLYLRKYGILYFFRKMKTPYKKLCNFNISIYFYNGYVCILWFHIWYIWTNNNSWWDLFTWAKTPDRLLKLYIEDRRRLKLFGSCVAVEFWLNFMWQLTSAIEVLKRCQNGCGVAGPKKQIKS